MENIFDCNRYIPIMYGDIGRDNMEHGYWLHYETKTYFLKGFRYDFYVIITYRN